MSKIEIRKVSADEFLKLYDRRKTEFLEVHGADFSFASFDEGFFDDVSFYNCNFRGASLMDLTGHMLTFDS